MDIAAALDDERNGRSTTVYCPHRSRRIKIKCQKRRPAANSTVRISGSHGQTPARHDHQSSRSSGKGDQAGVLQDLPFVHLGYPRRRISRSEMQSIMVEDTVWRRPLSESAPRRRRRELVPYLRYAGE